MTLKQGQQRCVASAEKRSTHTTLRSQRGASMLISLLLVLVCTVVAAIITTSSSVDVERNRQYLKEQQAYYAVRSALEAADDLVAGTGPIATTTLYASGDTLALSNGDANKVFTPYSTLSDDTNGLIAWASAQASLVLNGQQASLSPLTIDVSMSQTGSDAVSVPQVTLTFLMDPQGVADGADGAYDIQVTSQLSDASDLDYNYALSKTFSATAPNADNNNDPRTVTWGPGSSMSPDKTASVDQPVVGEAPTQAERVLTDVWDNTSGSGSRYDAAWEKLWSKVVWSTTALDGTYIAYNLEGYAVLAYVDGHYWAPQLSGSGAAGYEGSYVAVKLVNDKSEYATLAFSPVDATSTDKNVTRRGRTQKTDLWEYRRNKQSVRWVQVQ